MSDQKRLIFFGTSDFSAPTLEYILEGGYGLVGVVTKPDSRSGRGRDLVAPEIKTIAEDHNLPVLQPKILDEEFESHIQKLRPDVGIVVSYGKIIPAEILTLFPLGLINIHTSLLPKYRGASPIEQAILHGDAETGISIMKLDEGMDTGPVYLRAKQPLTGTETRPELYDRLSQLGAITLIEHLDDILDGDLTPRPQAETEASLAPLIQKADGIIDWHKPATQLEREIRAYLGWPGSRCTLLEREVTLTKVQVDELDDLKAGQVETGGNELRVGTGHQALIIERLKPAGKKEMTAAEFLRGHR